MIAFMNVGRDVGPPKECLDERRTVVEPAFQFEACAIRVQADSVHALKAVHRVVIAQPDGLRAVIVPLDKTLNRHEGSGAVMLRPIELDAA